MVLAIKDSIYDKVISNIQEVNARGSVIAIANEGDKEIEKFAKHVIYIPVHSYAKSAFVCYSLAVTCLPYSCDEGM